MVKSVLFVCNMNSVRSPMGEAIARHLLPKDVKVESCGVYKGAIDPFVHRSLNEAGIEPSPAEPREFAECHAASYDLVVALTPEAAAEARRQGATVEYWEVENPTDTRGSVEDIMAAYGRLREQLSQLIKERFSL